MFIPQSQISDLVIGKTPINHCRLCFQQASENESALLFNIARPAQGTGLT